MILDGLTVLITGGTGSFGQRFVKEALKQDVRKVVVFSRDELKQFNMRMAIDDSRLQFLLGDVRDRDRLMRAFNRVDIVVHAAALKQIPAIEYNPFEAVKTNILGSQNVIDVAIDREVKQVLAISTDKASEPLNFYGATKLCMEKLFIASNHYAGLNKTRFSVVKYGNVVGSNGSVIPLYEKLKDTGVLPVTDMRMTRFWITLDQGVNFVMNSLARMEGGEIFVPKLPSMRVIDLAKAIAPNCSLQVTGIRPGEKLHEVMITENDARNTFDFGDHYEIHPVFHWWRADDIKGGEKVEENFRYSSDTNKQWLSVDELRRMVCQ